MKIELKLPKAWPELSEKQLLFVAKLHLEALPRVEFLTLCVLNFCNLVVVKNRSTEVVFKFKNKRDHFVIDNDMWYTLCQKLDWLVGEFGQITNLTKIGEAEGCNSRMYGVTLEQMLLADNYYAAYNATKKTKYLAMLAAVFYQKPGQKFESGKVAAVSKYFLKYNAEMKIILIWYTGIKLSFKEKFPLLYNGAGGADQSPEEIVLNTLSALNGGDITKNAALYQCEAVEALKQLHNLAERAAKLKK